MVLLASVTPRLEKGTLVKKYSKAQGPLGILALTSSLCPRKNSILFLFVDAGKSHMNDLHLSKLGRYLTKYSCSPHH